jgi:hypothetical protein
MTDTQQIHLENLRESLKHYDAFLRLCVLSSLTAAACSLTGRAPSTEQVVLFDFLPLPRSGLSLFAHAAQFVFALLAASALDSVHRAQRALIKEPEIFRAALGYPSLATAPSSKIRQCAVLASPVVLAISLIAEMLRTNARVEWIGVLFGYLLLCTPYLVLWIVVSVEQAPENSPAPVSGASSG